MDWLDLLVVHSQESSQYHSITQHTTSHTQHHTSHNTTKASILQHSAFFIVQLSHPCMTTGKTKARQTFVGKIMSLLFNMLSRFVITFLLRSKHLLVSWLQSPSSVILEPPKIKSVTVSTVSPSICRTDAVIRTGCHDLSFSEC